MVIGLAQSDDAFSLDLHQLRRGAIRRRAGLGEQSYSDLAGIVTEAQVHQLDNCGLPVCPASCQNEKELPSLGAVK